MEKSHLKAWKVIPSPLFFQFLCVVLAVTIFACGQRNKHISLKKVNSYPAIEANSFGHQLVPLIHSGGSMLGYLNKDSLKLEIYRLGSKEAIFTIDLDSLSKNYYLYPHYFVPLQPDSIFLFSAANFDTDVTDVLLINRKGKLLNSWDIKELYPGKEAYVLQPNQESPVLYKNHRLYFQKILKYYNYSTPESRKMAYSEPTELILDISSGQGKVENEIGSHPKEYHKANYRDLFTSRCLGPHELLVYSYHSLSDVMVFDNEGNMKRYNAGSDYIDHINSLPDEVRIDPAASMKYMREEPKYGAVYFLPSQQLYVRLAHHRQQMFNQEGKATGFRNSEKSLVILDADYKRIGEYLINMETFNHLIGVTDNGLLLSEKINEQDKFSVYELLVD